MGRMCIRGAEYKPAEGVRYVYVPGPARGAESDAWPKPGAAIFFRVRSEQESACNDHLLGAFSNDAKLRKRRH